MFDYFRGNLAEKNPPFCTVEVGGVGYKFLISKRTHQLLPSVNEEIKLYAKLIHKEDSMTLCGFLHKREKVIFETLIAVSGIGTKAAFALLDEFEINELIEAVIAEDFKTISRAKGIGSKMAQKIVIELKDRLTKLEDSPVMIKKSSSSVVSDETISQTVTILQSLGYNQDEYKSALELASGALNKDDEQELLREVLKILSTF